MCKYHLVIASHRDTSIHTVGATLNAAMDFPVIQASATCLNNFINQSFVALHSSSSDYLGLARFLVDPPSLLTSADCCLRAEPTVTLISYIELTIEVLHFFLFILLTNSPEEKHSIKYGYDTAEHIDLLNVWINDIQYYRILNGICDYNKIPYLPMLHHTVIMYSIIPSPYSLFNLTFLSWLWLFLIAYNVPVQCHKIYSFLAHVKDFSSSLYKIFF